MLNHTSLKNISFLRLELRQIIFICSCLLLSNSVTAQVDISASSLSGSVDLAAGGSSTPFDPAPVQESEPVVNGSIAISEDTGNQLAKNGLGEEVGSSQADGAVNVQSALSGLSLNGTGSSSSAYQATGQGTAGSNSNLTVEIYFTVSSPVDFTFAGEVTGDTTSTQDRVQVQRKIFGSWSVAVAGADGTTGAVNTSATFQPGNEYRMYASMITTASGGEAQSPKSELVDYTYDLTFEDGTTVSGDINEVAEEAVPLPAWSLAALGLVVTFIVNFRRKPKYRLWSVFAKIARNNNS